MWLLTHGPVCRQVNRNIISTFPEVDSPEMFGLHPNADLTFRVKETTALLSTILDTQPKESAAAGGATREDVVSAKASELRDKLPESYIQDDVQARIGEVGGLSAPLNIFLFQEVQRLSAVIDNVRTTLSVRPQTPRTCAHTESYALCTCRPSSKPSTVKL